MARSKQTARKSTGGLPPRAHLATNQAAAQLQAPDPSLNQEGLEVPDGAPQSPMPNGGLQSQMPNGTLHPQSIPGTSEGDSLRLQNGVASPENRRPAFPEPKL